MKEKVSNADEIRKAYPNYTVIFGVFSKSGFTQRLLDAADENPDILLFDGDRILR